MEQLERIREMEAALDSASSAVSALSDALDKYVAVLPTLKKLSGYYESPLWLSDLDDDNSGRLPRDLKRGVLSEDAVFDLLTDDGRLRALMADILKNE